MPGLTQYMQDAMKRYREKQGTQSPYMSDNESRLYGRGNPQATLNKAEAEKKEEDGKFGEMLANAVPMPMPGRSPSGGKATFDQPGAGGAAAREGLEALGVNRNPRRPSANEPSERKSLEQRLASAKERVGNEKFSPEAQARAERRVARIQRRQNFLQKQRRG